MSLRSVGFVTHPRRAEAVNASRALRAALEAEGVEVSTLSDDEPDLLVGAPPDLVVAVGGDGTFLRGAYAACRLDAPVLGVKVGRMGFLTETDPDGALALIRSVLDGRARIEERLAMVAGPADGGSFEAQWGLNEVMVEKRARHRLIRLAVEVGGTYVTTFSADGVIVASPTGSTAYSFSARGPIVDPRVGCLVLTPVAAHMVFDRSFVLDPGSSVVLTVTGEESGILSADGREGIEVEVGARVKISASDRPVRLVRHPDALDFFSLVREKFLLPGDDAQRLGAGD
jgi:NAD+ kinase